MTLYVIFETQIKILKDVFYITVYMYRVISGFYDYGEEIEAYYFEPISDQEESNKTGSSQSITRASLV